MAALAGMGISGGGQTKFDATDVNDQLGKTLNKGGLLMRMAQSKGQQVASSRGLSNSTIGIDAAQRAVVDAALPIAQQNAQQSLQQSMQNNSFGHDKEMAGINFTNQSKLNQQQNTFSAGENALNRQQQLTMQGNDFANQTKLNEQQNQFSAGQSALDRQQQTSILDKQQSFQSGQSALDRNQQLTMQGNEFKNQSALTNQQAQLQEKRDRLLWQQQLGTLDKQGQLELQQLDKQLSNQQTLNTQQFGQQKELNEQQAYLQAERDTLQNKFQQGILDKEGQQRLTELDKQLSNQKALNEQQNRYNSAEAQKDRAHQLTLLEKNASKDLAYLAQQVAANTHGMYLSAIDSQVSNYNERIAALEADQTIKTSDKPAMKAGMEKELNATLQMYGSLYSNINTIRPDWTQFPTKELPKVGAGQTTGSVVAPIKPSVTTKTPTTGEQGARPPSNVSAPIKPKTPTSGESAARTTVTKPPVGTMLPTNVAAPIRPNVVTTPKVPTPGELAARSPQKVAAPIRQLDKGR